MKRIYFFILSLFLVFVCPFIVSAETISSYTWTNAFSVSSTASLESQFQFYNSHLAIINDLKQYYNENLSSYSYYYIVGTPSNAGSFCLYFTNDNSVRGIVVDNLFRYVLSYSGSYCFNSGDGEYHIRYGNGIDANSYASGASYILETNSPFSYSSSSYASYDTYLEVVYPDYVSEHFNIQSFSILDNNPIPTVLSLYDETYDNTDVIGYTEINLNSYDYVILSLKDYSQSSAFSTIFYVKGQLCLTPVYNYGMKEKSSFYPDWQPPGCSPITYEFSPQYVSILEQDLSNHAVYYLKAFDTNIDNIVKVDLSIFDVFPISSSNANNPSVTINGRSYPTIPYNDLNSSSTQSEEEGYISGEVKNVFDISSDSSFIETLFSNPLEALGNVWTSIISMFALVGTFMGLLPPTLQYFLYTGFSLGIVLGVLKILL